MAKKYRKKPIIIEAVPFHDNAESLVELSEFIGETITVDYADPTNPTFQLKTLEGTITASVGDYIIKGAHGEFYPCKPYVFNDTYDEYLEENEMTTTNTIKQEQIDELLIKAKITTATVFEKCTIVCVQLENGFIITESSACVDPANYDEKVGIEICIERIKNKLWELEGYNLQKKVYEDATEK